jgi:hypothetical protein
MPRPLEGSSECFLRIGPVKVMPEARVKSRFGKPPMTTMSVPEVSLATTLKVSADV